MDSQVCLLLLLFQTTIRESHSSVFILNSTLPEPIDAIFEDMDDDFGDNPDVEIVHRTDVQGGGGYDVVKLNYRPPSERSVRYQYDMLIEEQTFNRIMSMDTSRWKRAAARGELTKLWPTIIPYEIQKDFSMQQKYWIMRAIKHVMQYTCIVFKERERREEDYIKFAKVKKGCYTQVGNMRLENRISLNPKCTERHIVHEIGHALGLFHEHMRYDRDQFVRIYYQNIRDDRHNQFDKLLKKKYDDYDTPYDLRSVMHYGKHFFGKKKANGKDRLVTMETLDPNYTDIIGTAEGLSFYDIQTLNEMYKCSAGCQSKKCEGDQFLGMGCKCYCAGTENKTAVACPQPTSCQIPPTSCSVKYCFEDKDTQKKLNSGDDVPHGDTAVISYCDTKPCGHVTSTIKCNDGIWEGDTRLQCIEETCEIDPVWNSDHKISRPEVGLDLNSIVHGHQISMECKENPTIKNTLTCLHGQWKEHIFPCTGNNCSIVNDTDDLFKYTPANEDYYDDDDTLEHGEQIEITCKFNDTIATYVTCNDGTLVEETPIDCPKENCEIYSEWESEYEISPSHFDPSNPDSNVIIHGEYVTMWCPNGSVNLDFTLTCSNGDWNGTIIPCTGESCVLSNKPEQLYKYTSGGNDLADNEIVDHGADVQVTCKYNETIVTNSTCIDGTVKEDAPIECPQACLVPKVANGRVESRNVGDSIGSGEHVILSCRNRKFKATCKDGIWNSGTFPVCPKDLSGCSKLENAIVTGPVKGRYNPYTVNCEVGFVKVKKSDKTTRLKRKHFRCTKTNKWAPIVPFCSPAPCTVPVVDYGSVQQNGFPIQPRDSVKSGEEVQVTCEDARKSKDVTAVCDLGNWNPDQFPTCPKACSYDEGHWKEINTYRLLCDNHTSYRYYSFQNCMERCEDETEFLCLAVSYGYVDKHFRCYLHRVNPDDHPEKMKRDANFSMAVRLCDDIF